MKYLYGVPLLFLLLTSCAKDKKEEEVLDRAKTDWAVYKLNGNVKSVTEKSYTYVNSIKGPSGRENQMLRDTDLQFDAKGNLTNLKTYRTETSVAEEYIQQGKDKIIKRIQYVEDQPGIITEYLYDESGKNNTSITRRNASNAQQDRIEMKFRGNNMVEKTTYNNQNHPIDIITYDYDEKGNVKGENWFVGIQTVKVRSGYKYDDKNRKIEETRYTPEALISRTVYAYNDNDKLVSEETFGTDGKLEYSEKFGYDANNNMISQVTYQPAENSRSEEIYTYDKNNNMLSMTFSKSGVVVNKVQYAYDVNNNLIASKGMDGTGKVRDSRTYKYEYDANNNWTKKIVTVNGQPQFIEQKTITYY